MDVAGCNAGDADKCVAAADPNVSDYGGLLARACELGRTGACCKAASQMHHDYQLDYDKNWLDEEKRRAATYYTKGCLAGGAWCCRPGAQLYAPSKPLQARKLLQKGCELGSAQACYDLSLGLVAGWLGKVDEAAALKWLTKACEQMDEQLGCSNLDFFRYIGIGQERDFSLAPELGPGCGKDPESAACRLTKRLTEQEKGVNRIRGLLVRKGKTPVVLHAGAKLLTVSTQVEIITTAKGSIGGMAVVGGPVLEITEHRIRLQKDGMRVTMNYELGNFVIVEWRD